MLFLFLLVFYFLIYLFDSSQKSALFKVESWFLLHVRRWLLSTYNATPEWVMNAIDQDEVI
jgi:hypothetical protein